MTLKEKCKKWSAAAKKFWDEYKIGIVCGGGFLVGSWLTYKLVKTEESIPRTIYQPVPVPIPTPVNEEGTDSWDEEKMRKNWDWVCELASNMELESGESYSITNGYGSCKLGAGAEIGNNIVEHHINGKEIYPDDIESYELMYDPEYEEDNEEEEDEDEEESNTYLIKLSDEADDDVRDIARKFSMLANNGLINIEMED